MTTPKLREDWNESANTIVEEYLEKYASPDLDASRYEQHYSILKMGMGLALSNLHKLLEPREMPIINGKKVAIVEVEGE